MTVDWFGLVGFTVAFEKCHLAVEKHNVEPEHLKASQPGGSWVDKVEEVETTPCNLLPLVKHPWVRAESHKQESKSSLGTNSQVADSGLYEEIF